MWVEIEEERGKLVRDTNSMAIINVDRSALSRDAVYKQRLKKDEEVESRINNLQSEVSSIKSSVDKILEILNSNRGS